VLVAIDVTAPMYVYLERGSIRGSAIDTFYKAYDAGDMAAAYQAFRSAAVPTARVTDYGWNGLGVPWITDEGAEIGDILYRSVNGVFARAPEITAKDIGNYIAALHILVDALEGS